MTQRIAKFGTKNLTLVGEELKVGDKAPNFIAMTKDLVPFDFYKETEGLCIISVIPSIDTSTCELQTYLLNKAADKSNKKFKIISMSNDLPFAHRRFMKDKEFEHVEFLTDYLRGDFANNYGVLIEEFHLLTRAIFIIDEQKNIRHVEYLTQTTEIPDIDKVMEVIESL